MDRLFKILIEVQEGRALPRVLVDLQRVREPDGLEGGRDRVDVVARGGAPRRPGRELPLRVPEGGHARLVQRPGDPEARHRREARRGVRLPQLDVRGLPRRADHAPGLLHRERHEPAGVAAAPAVRSRPRSLRSRRRSTSSGTTASRPRATSRASPDASATSRRARYETVARSSGAPASTPPGTRSTPRTCTR